MSKRNIIIKFYNESIKNHSQSAQIINQKDELTIMHILTIFLQENVAFRSDARKYRTLKTNMNKLIQIYTHKLFKPINNIPEFKMFIKVLKEAGLLAQMIESYPTLARSKNAYEVRIDEIIHTKIN